MKTLSTLRFRAVCLLPALLGLLTATSIYARDATWLLDPADNNWSNPANWMRHKVPHTEDDVATFGVSNITEISLVDSVALDGLTFDAGASAFTFTVPSGKTLTFTNPLQRGVINNSGVTQEFIVDGGTIEFNSFDLAGSLVHYHLLGSSSRRQGGTILFQSGSGADRAIFDLEGGDGPEHPPGRITILPGANGGSATFVLHGAGANRGPGGAMRIDGSAGLANITAEGSNFKGVAGALIEVFGDAGASTMTVQGGAGGEPARLLFEGGTTGSATLVADGGAIFAGNPGAGGTARLIINDNGSLDIRSFNFLAIAIGSLEGEQRGVVLLGSNKLTIGSLNSNTVYRGVIRDGPGGSGGSIAKIGAGSLTLSGDNLYTGGTTLSEGKLIVANRAGSGTGTGPVQVNAGQIGGAGTIAGALTVGSGSGSGATLMPALKTNQQVTMVIESALTLNADATYSYGINTILSTADSVVANGVTIDPNARFVLRSQGTGAFPPGTVFIAINNTAATAITGNFSGLSEGSIIVAGNNTYRVSYVGGDGNDFTLTVL